MFEVLPLALRGNETYKLLVFLNGIRNEEVDIYRDELCPSIYIQNVSGSYDASRHHPRSEKEKTRLVIGIGQRTTRDHESKTIIMTTRTLEVVVWLFKTYVEGYLVYAMSLGS